MGPEAEHGPIEQYQRDPRVIAAWRGFIDQQLFGGNLTRGAVSRLQAILAEKDDVEAFLAANFILTSRGQALDVESVGALRASAGGLADFYSTHVFDGGNGAVHPSEKIALKVVDVLMDQNTAEALIFPGYEEAADPFIQDNEWYRHAIGRTEGVRVRPFIPISKKIAIPRQVDDEIRDLCRAIVSFLVAGIPSPELLDEPADSKRALAASWRRRDVLTVLRQIAIEATRRGIINDIFKEKDPRISLNDIDLFARKLGFTLDSHGFYSSPEVSDDLVKNVRKEELARVMLFIETLFPTKPAGPF